MIKIKVCGITKPAEAHVAAGTGATDAVGLVFAESPRRVSADDTSEVAAVLPG